MSPLALVPNPAALSLLLLAPLAWALLRASDGRRARRMAEMAGPRWKRMRGGRRAARRLLLAAGLACALAAALRPAPDAAERTRAWLGADVVLCLDVSRSMLAQDLAPDRLTRARAEIRALAGRARGERLGLVAFAGEARPVAPLTKDAVSVADLADLADPGSVARGGTDLGAALDVALGLLAGPEAQRGVVVLLTDGEDHEGRGQAAARRCRERGLTVLALGLATPLGGKIPEEGGGFLSDAAGTAVVSRLDAAGLARVAEAGGGTFAPVTDRSLVALYEERIAPRAQAGDAEDAAGWHPDAFRLLLAAAFLLWLLDLALLERARP